jgi:hypothetical protein
MLGCSCLPVEERKAKLAALLQKPPAGIRFSISFTEKISELLGRALALSLEVLIAKRAGSRGRPPGLTTPPHHHSKLTISNCLLSPSQRVHNRTHLLMSEQPHSDLPPQFPVAFKLCFAVPLIRNLVGWKARIAVRKIQDVCR